MFRINKEWIERSPARQHLNEQYIKYQQRMNWKVKSIGRKDTGAKLGINKEWIERRVFGGDGGLAPRINKEWIERSYVGFPRYYMIKIGINKEWIESLFPLCFRFLWTILYQQRMNWKAHSRSNNLTWTYSPVSTKNELKAEDVSLTATSLHSCINKEWIERMTCM